MLDKKIIYELKLKVFTITIIVVVIFTAFLINKPILANESFPEMLVREDNYSTTTKENSGEQFSTNASDLLANSRSEQLNTDFNKYINIEIGEWSCNVTYGLATHIGSVLLSIFSPNIPASTFSFSLSTPTRGRQTVKLESEESAAPELQELCYETINSIREIDSRLYTPQIHEPVKRSELELTIKKTWNKFNW